MFLPLSVCEDRVFTCMFTPPSMHRPNPPRPVPSCWSVHVAPMEATTAPGAFNAKLKLIFSLALAVTFTSLPRRRLALDIPPVAFFIPGGSKCVCMSVCVCMVLYTCAANAAAFSIYQRKCTWVDFCRGGWVGSTECVGKRAILTGGLI